MANKVEFKYAPMFQLGKDNTEYRLLTKEGVSTAEFDGKEILKVSKEALTLLAQQAFHDCEFMLRREHNKQVAAILSDPEASENDKYVALQFLRNAEVSVKGVLLSAKIQALQSYTERKDSVSGLILTTRKHLVVVFTIRLQKRIFVIRRTHHLICMTR